MATGEITSSQRAAFEEDGYIIIEDFFDQETSERVRAELSNLVNEEAEKLLKAGLIEDARGDEPFETRLWELYRDHPEEAPASFRLDPLHREAFYRYFFNKRLLDLVEEVLGPEIRLYPNYTCRPKFPELGKTEVNWHQDGAYTIEDEDVEELRMINVWSPLVSAYAENGCMEFVPGTHKLGVVPHEERDRYLEIAPEHLEPRLGEATPIELDPCDVVLFNNLLFHCGRPNEEDHVRWSLDWRYQDATQSTLRDTEGHIARSRENPDSAVSSPSEWASRKPK